MKSAVEGFIRKKISELYPEIDLQEIPVTPPDDLDFGDLSTSIAFPLAKNLRKAPKIIASEIAESLNKNIDKNFESIDAIDGYINFKYSKHYLQQLASQIVSDSVSFARSDIGNGEKVQLEYVSANPTGPLNIVSARAASVGSTIVNLMRNANFDIKSEYYVNDAGGQVERLERSFEIRYRNLLGENLAIPEDGYFGKYLIDYGKKLLDEKGKEPLNLPQDGRKKFFEEYIIQAIFTEQIKNLETFQTHFDLFIRESELRKSGKVDKLISRLSELGAIYEKDGAKWFKASDYRKDAEDSVIVKSDGEWTYYTIDIAYHIDKFERGFNRVMDIWGPDHHAHISRMDAAMTALGYTGRFKVIMLQQVNLLEGGEKLLMSKRAGKIITMDELITAVGVDVARYFFLMRRIESHLDFDLDLAKTQSDENPVYYIQYAYARIRSILRFALGKGFKFFPDEAKKYLPELVEDEELTLLRKLAHYPMILEKSAIALEPHLLPAYLTELARLFHNFYHKHRVIGVGVSESLSYARLTLIQSVAEIIAHGLEIMGVTAPETM